MSEHEAERHGSSSSPLERILDLAVYGPIGLAITAKDVLPKWVDVGRRQVGSQMTLARTLGRMAVNQGSRQAGDAVRRAAEQAESMLVGLGVVPGARTDSRAGQDRPGAADSRFDVDVDAHTGARTGARPEAESGYVAKATASAPTVVGGPTAAQAGRHVPPGQAEAAGTDPAKLAIPGYDTLSASQVVQRLAGLSSDELEAVRLHELAGRNRKTVLLKVAQLRQGS